MSKKYLPAKADDVSEWYNTLIQLADLADYGPAKGTMIFKPYGYALWENVQTYLGAMIKAKGVENAYFPLFIPESLINKEKTHVEGFSPELAVVTIGGGEELQERLVVRPTSETIMYDAYSKWIQSWRDLPVMINQWNNVVRWEKRTALFLRTTEFLWQEGHTAHASEAEAQEIQRWAMDMYDKFYREYFAMDGFVGYKSETERFAGAVSSLTYESLMPSGKALQSATSHDLGQNFAKAFDISYQAQSGKDEHVWQTSWGLSTRSLGGLILMHGDDNGLRLPPKVAPIQVVVLPVRNDAAILKYAAGLVELLAAQGIRVRLDERDDETIGFKINKWEVKGVPVRIEIGNREVENKELTVARRDQMGEKQVMPYANAAESIPKLLDDIQDSLYKSSVDFTKANTREADNFDEFSQIMKQHKGFIKALWCGEAKCEADIKQKTTATTRCLPFNGETKKGQCVHCGKAATNVWLFAQAY